MTRLADFKTWYGAIGCHFLIGRGARIVTILSRSCGSVISFALTLRFVPRLTNRTFVFLLTYLLAYTALYVNILPIVLGFRYNLRTFPKRTL